MVLHCEQRVLLKRESIFVAATMPSFANILEVHNTSASFKNKTRAAYWGGEGIEEPALLEKCMKQK